MRSLTSSRIIRPKISTMPRQSNQATTYLEIYQLAVEKKASKTRITSHRKAKSYYLSATRSDRRTN
ncbi:hypothetical protein AM228_03560 [Planktothricoides sp. SR001]|nr:hypothetical protein AM228_03560 [Planktothricoides sp. SR001]